jgi:hypothetical protein
MQFQNFLIAVAIILIVVIVYFIYTESKKKKKKVPPSAGHNATKDVKNYVETMEADNDKEAEDYYNLGNAYGLNLGERETAAENYHRALNEAEGMDLFHLAGRIADNIGAAILEAVAENDADGDVDGGANNTRERNGRPRFVAAAAGDDPFVVDTFFPGGADQFGAGPFGAGPFGADPLGANQPEIHIEEFNMEGLDLLGAFLENVLVERLMDIEDNFTPPEHTEATEDMITWHSDSQNVHDRQVNRDLKKKYEFLKEGMSGRSKEDVLKDLSKEVNAVGGDAKKAFDSFRSNNYVSTFGCSDRDVLIAVWARVNSPQNLERQDDLKRAFFMALEGCIEGGLPVCTHGRCAHIMGSLDLLDMDEDVAQPIRNREVVRNEIFEKTGFLRDKILNEAGDEIKEKYNGGNEEDAEVIKVVSDIHRAIDEMKAEYKDIPEDELSKVIDLAKQSV